MSAQVIILTGPPGAGKSTLAAKLARGYGKGVHLHTDDFWHCIVSGAIPPYAPTSDAQNQTVMDVVAGAAYTYARGDFTTVIDGIIGPWTLPTTELTRHSTRTWRSTTSCSGRSATSR